MKKIFFIFLLSIIQLALIMGQGVPGTIYFSDGETLKFSNVTELDGTCNNAEPDYNGVVVFHQGTKKILPFSIVTEIEVLSFEKIVFQRYGDKSQFELINAQLSVKTKTNMTVQTEYARLAGIKIDYTDVLTNTFVRNQTVSFSKKVSDDKQLLNIRKIVFN
ncbi:MAG: hypothetical protein JXB00_00095 [Bacteroidales bacterium]|nr:hypothetical protein [Bacteroidales bacterium]